jgi:hypothetical protein
MVVAAVVVVVAAKSFLYSHFLNIHLIQNTLLPKKNNNDEILYIKEYFPAEIPVFHG